MNRTKIITVWQVFALLFVSRIIIFLTYSPAYIHGENPQFSALSAAAFFPVSLLLMFPLYLLFHTRRDLNLLQLSDFALGRAGKAVPVLIGLYLLLAGCVELTRYNLFISSEVMTEESIFLLSVCVILCAVAGAYMGIQGLSRAAGIFLVLIVGAIIFIFLALLPEMRLTNVEPLSFQGLDNVWNLIMLVFGRNYEIVALMLLIPMVKGSLKKGAIWWTAGQLACYALIIIPSLFALGAFGQTQKYPYYASAQLAQWWIFQRLDALHSAIWIAAMFLKLSTLLFLFTLCVSHLFGDRVGKISLPVAGAVVTGAGIYLSMHEDTFLTLYNGSLMTPISLFFSFTLPLLVWVFTVIRKRKAGRPA